jgi:hypothetical protein
MVHFNVGSRHVLASPGRTPIVVDIPKPLASLPGLNSQAGYHSWSRPRLDASWMRMPGLSMPRMRMPDVSMPRMRMPEVTMPWTGSRNRMSWARMPDLSMPRMSMPSGRRMPWDRSTSWARSMPLGRASSMPWMRTISRGRRQTAADSMPMLLLGMACGAAVMYFADPQQGKRRRKLAIDRGGAMIRRGFRALNSRRRKIASDMYGKRQAVIHSDVFDNGRRRMEDVAASTPLRSSPT